MRTDIDGQATSPLTERQFRLICGLLALPVLGGGVALLLVTVFKGSLSAILLIYAIGHVFALLAYVPVAIAAALFLRRRSEDAALLTTFLLPVAFAVVFGLVFGKANLIAGAYIGVQAFFFAFLYALAGLGLYRLARELGWA